MNSIVVFGKGTCGNATASIFNNEVDFHDPEKGFYIEDYTNYCYAIIAVPTNEIESGLDHHLIENCYEKLFRGGFNGIVLIRSTCGPLFLRKIVEIYEKTVYWPEFLTEANSIKNAMYPNILVIGSVDKELVSHVKKLLEKYNHATNIDWIFTDIESASLIKLGINTALASKISMFNSLHNICENLGADWDTVRKGVASDPRIGGSHTMVPGPDGQKGFGGKCLPKDSNALAILAKENVYLDSIRQYNNKIRSGTK